MIGVGTEERRTGHKGHAIVDGAFGKHIAVSYLASRTCQTRPDKQTALRLDKLDRVTQLFAQGIAHGLGTFGIHRTDFV